MAAKKDTPQQQNSGNEVPVTIGVLALQGDYEAHARVFASLGHGRFWFASRRSYSGWTGW